MNLNAVIIDHIETILDYFQIEYRKNRDKIICACPIHGGTSESSLNIFSEGNFKCWSQNCDGEIGCGVFNLVQFLLNDKFKVKHSFREVCDFLRDLTNCELLEESEENKELRQFCNFVSQKKTIKVGTQSRTQVRLNLTIPSEYYLKRGYSKDILCRYDVGLCYKKHDELFMRTVVPVYDENFKLIGRLGRSPNKKCLICDKFHEKNKICPTNDLERKWSHKWINSTGFRTGESFYNLWYAAPLIKSSQSVILVEGCGDVWRLEESGIHISLGLFGLELTEDKLEILNRLGVMNVYLALDNDVAGQEQTKKIYEQTKNYFNLHIINTIAHDWGDSTKEEICQLFKGIL